MMALMMVMVAAVASVTLLFNSGLITYTQMHFNWFVYDFNCCGAEILNQILARDRENAFERQSPDLINFEMIGSSVL